MRQFVSATESTHNYTVTVGKTLRIKRKMYSVKANLRYRVLFIQALLPSSYQKMMNVLCVTIYSDSFCFVKSVGRNLFVIMSYVFGTFFRNETLSILTSNHSSNAIQQRNVTFDLSRRSLVSACAVFLMQFPLKILSITCP